MTPRSPADLRAKAQELDQRALAALRRGDAALAKEIAEIAAECEALAAVMEERGIDSRSAVVHREPVTVAEAFARRVSAARAKTDPPDELVKAIVEDPAKRWRSGTDYAKRRLGISPSTFHNYRNGISPPTRAVDKKVRADFPGLSWTWKKPPVD